MHYIEHEGGEVLTHEGLNFSLTSCIDTGSYVEAIYEVGANEDGRAVVSVINTLPGIRTVSLVDCRKDG